jgi:hypothetical protein
MRNCKIPGKIRYALRVKSTKQTNQPRQTSSPLPVLGAPAGRGCFKESSRPCPKFDEICEWNTSKDCIWREFFMKGLTGIEVRSETAKMRNRIRRGQGTSRYVARDGVSEELASFVKAQTK